MGTLLVFGTETTQRGGSQLEQMMMPGWVTEAWLANAISVLFEGTHDNDYFKHNRSKTYKVPIRVFGHVVLCSTRTSHKQKVRYCFSGHCLSASDRPSAFGCS